MSSLLEQVAGRASVVDEVLTGSLAEGEVLSGVELVEQVDLSRVRLPDSVLDGCTFIGCKALATSWSMLREPVLAPDPCTWVDCQLSMGSFGGLDLTGARFDRCVLTDADFDGAVLRAAVVDDCSLAGARLVRVDLREADLRTARDYVVDARDAQLAGLRVDPVGALGLLAPFGVVVE